MMLHLGRVMLLPDDRERSLTALDNFARVCAVLFESWDIDHFHKCPGHQDIQDDKQDPGNALEACGYGRHEIDVIDNLVQKYMDGTDVDKDTITDLPEKDDVIEKNQWDVHVLKYGLKNLITEEQLNMTHHYVNVLAVALITIVLQVKKMYLKRVPQYTFMKKFKIHKVTFGVEHIHQVTMAGCISTLLK